MKRLTRGRGSQVPEADREKKLSALIYPEDDMIRCQCHETSKWVNWIVPYPALEGKVGEVPEGLVCWDNDPTVWPDESEGLPHNPGSVGDARWVAVSSPG